jgi:hypothetical protein
MKTKVNISNLKKVAVTFCSALVLTTGSFIQANPDASVNDERVAIARLEVRMNETEHSVMFVAPAVAEITPEMERLTALAELTEVSLKYVAPAAEVAPELVRLDLLAGITETALQYVAPAVAEEEFVTPELERLDVLAAATEASIRFMAAVVEEPLYNIINDNSTEIMLAERTK